MNTIWRTFDREGKAISIERCDELRSNKEYRKILKTNFNEEKSVSTVWLGIDHGEGIPLIFESMVFDTQENPFNNYMEQYSTEDEARQGHKIIVDAITPNPISSFLCSNKWAKLRSIEVWSSTDLRLRIPFLPKEKGRI